MSNQPRASEARDERASHDKVWTHLFIEFPLEREVRLELEERLKAEGTTLTRIVIDALSEYVHIGPGGAAGETTKTPDDDAAIDASGGQP